MRRLALSIAVAVACVSSPAFAQDYKAGALVIQHPFARATPPSATVGGGYLTVVNGGQEADRLVSVTSEATPRVELHEMTMANGVMTMRPLANGVPIPAGKTVNLKPGGLHVMFMGLRKPFVLGERIKARLTFEKAGAVDVEFAVESMGATKPAAPGQSHDHSH